MIEQQSSEVSKHSCLNGSWIGETILGQVDAGSMKEFLLKHRSWVEFSSLA